MSFILPAFRGEFFEAAVRSILAQTEPDFELVVVDDCSPDDLRGILSGISDSRIRYYRNETNLGGRNLVENWNRALQYAMGEFCVLASDDDIYAPRYLETMLKLAARYPEADLFHCRLGRIDANGRLTAISPLRSEHETQVDFLYARGVERRLQVAPDFFFRRTAILDISGFVDFPLAWYSDEATWYLLAGRGGVGYSSDVLFYWRFSGRNISARTDNIRTKLQASRLYQEWFRRFHAGLPQPESSEQRFLLEECGRLLPSRIDGQAAFDLGNASCRQWAMLLPHLAGGGTSPVILLKAIGIKFRNLLRCVFH